MGYAFISYCTKNQTAADAIRELFNKHHIDTWMAPYDIPAGSKYAAEITKAIRGCDCFVLLLSNDSQASAAVDSEVELAALKFKKSIITVELEKVVLNDAFTLYIHNKQIIAVRTIDEGTDEVKKILDAVKVYTAESETGQVLHKANEDGFADVATELDDDNKEPSTANKAEKAREENVFSVGEETNVCEKAVAGAPSAEEGAEKAEEEPPVYEKETTESVNTATEGSSEEKEDEKRSIQIGRLVGSYKKVVDFSKDECKTPIEIDMPNGRKSIFDFCDEFTVDGQHYMVVSQKVTANVCLFFIFRNEKDKQILVVDGQEQAKVYRWFRTKHKSEYVFADGQSAEARKKKKHFAQDTAQGAFANAEDIPQILVLPNKYEHIAANAFAKLKPSGKEIRQIVIPDSVEVIEDNAFAGLVVTEAVYIPASVKKLGDNAFDLKKGAYVYFLSRSRAACAYSEKHATAVMDNPYKRTAAFEVNAILAEMHCCKDITRIKSHLFPCKTPRASVEEIVVPEGVCVIDAFAFSNATVTGKVIIPSSVTRIGKNAFDLSPEGYVVCDKNSYAYLYCRENGIRNSVDMAVSYKNEGVCAYCGGEFQGLFKKRCRLCGKEKDY